MKGRLITVLYIILMIVSSGCTNPVQMPEIEQEEVKETPAEPRVPEIAEPVLEEPEVYIEEEEEAAEYVYTIIGTWRRDFDQHTEYYVISETELVTFIDWLENGRYPIEHGADWTFTLINIGVVFDYELLHSEELDVLVIGGYQYVKVQ